MTPNRETPRRFLTSPGEGHPASQQSHHHGAQSCVHGSASLAPTPDDGGSVIDVFGACCAAYEHLAECGLLSELVVDTLAAILAEAESVVV